MAIFRWLRIVGFGILDVVVVLNALVTAGFLQDPVR